MSDVDGASSFHALAQQLTRLHAVVESRRGGDFASSYTAGLIADPRRAAKKMGEEAVETVIAAAMGDLEAVAAESADLLYHLLALWAAVGLSPDGVAAALAAREGTSGLAEKATRGA